MLVVEHQNVHPLLAYWPHPSPLAFFALIIITNGERDTENTNRSSFPVTRLPKCHASYEMRTDPMVCLCFKSVNNCMLYVMGDKQHRMGLAELRNHGNFQRPLPLWGEEDREPAPVRRTNIGALSYVMCPEWLVLCLIYVWGQSLTPSLSNLNVHSKGPSLPAARLCPLSVCRSYCLFLTNRLTLQSICLSSRWSVCF